jgi:hypothetical protein
MAVGKIPGYTYGTPEVTGSPVSPDELELLKSTVLFGPDDEAALRRAGMILEPKIDDVLDLWYGFVGSNPHLLASFTDTGGQPIGDYLERVRARFGQWIRDLCNRPFDRDWLDYQHEIALRHAREKKNRTDAVASTAEIPMRYLVAFIVPITETIRPFLATGAANDKDLDQMHTAWFKAVSLSVVLWCRPYVRDGSW